MHASCGHFGAQLNDERTLAYRWPWQKGPNRKDSLAGNGHGTRCLQARSGGGCRQSPRFWAGVNTPQNMQALAATLRRRAGPTPLHTYPSTSGRSTKRRATSLSRPSRRSSMLRRCREPALARRQAGERHASGDAGRARCARKPWSLLCAIAITRALTSMPESSGDGAMRPFAVTQCGRLWLPHSRPNVFPHLTIERHEQPGLESRRRERRLECRHHETASKQAMSLAMLTGGTLWMMGATAILLRCESRPQ